MDLAGKVAFVTGGSGDVGGAVSQALAAAGADVALSYVGNADGATTTLNAVRGMGRRAMAVQLDQRDAAAIERAAQEVVGALGRVDILVNNAAWNIGIPFSLLEALTAEIWDRVLETNLRGPYLLARALAPQLRAHGSGRIVNIASVGGLYPTSSSIAYSASKAGLIHLTRCLAVALACATPTSRSRVASSCIPRSTVACDSTPNTTPLRNRSSASTWRCIRWCWSSPASARHRPGWRPSSASTSRRRWRR